MHRFPIFRRKTISRQMLLWFLGTSLVPLAAATLVFDVYSYRAARRQAIEHLDAMAESKANQMETYASERRADALALARRVSVIAAFKNLSVLWRDRGFDSPEYAAAKREIHDYLQVYPDDYGYTNVYLVSRLGDELFELQGRGQAGTNYESGPYRDTELANSFRQALSTGDVAFSDFAPSARAGDAVATIAVPVLDGKTLLGISILEIGSAQVYGMVNNYSGLGKTGEIVVASLKGDTITFAAPTRYDPRAAFKRTLRAESDVAARLLQAARGAKVQRIGRDYRNVEVVAAGRYLPSWRWGMVAKMDADEVFAAIARERRWGFYLGALALIPVAAVAFWAAASLSNPIERLTEAAQRMASGDLSEQVEIKRRDEIGGLAKSFNTMAASLKTMYATIEQQVEQRTHELRDQEERFRQLAENIREVFWLRTPDFGEIIYVSPAYERLSGRSAASLYAAPAAWLDAIHPDDRARVGEKWRTAMAAEQEFAVEYRLLRPDGEIRWILDRGFPVRDASERIYRLAGIAEDVTERRKAEEAMRRAKEAAEAADRIKGDFLMNISHEIRTPMNGIIGLTGLALDTSLSAEQRGYLQGVMSSAESLLAMLNAILDFSRIEEEGLELERAPFKLREALGNTVRTLESRARDKGLAFVQEVEPDVPDDLIGDRARLWQVLVNLAGNAIKFTPQGQVSLLIETEQVEADNVVLQFSIQDTGIGIPPEKQDVLFKPFSQVDSSRTRTFGGVGMGLVVSARLVELMGGRIWLESEPGKGSNFHFTARFGRPPIAGPASGAPVSENLAAAQMAPSAPPPTGAAALRVLVVDDNPINQKLVVRLLQKAGHAVQVADDGRQAVQAATRDDFDVVLMDVQMPVMDGFEATAAIRRNEQPSGRRLPIIALTAHAMQGDREKCIEAGMDGYLAKPIQTNELFAALAAATGADCRGVAPSPCNPQPVNSPG